MQSYFCAVCDKPIKPCKHRKYSTLHDECMKDYLDKFDSTCSEDFNKNITTTVFPLKPKK